MSKINHTRVLKITDPEIERCEANPAIRQLRDPKWPLVYRYKRKRGTGSFFIVRHLDNKTEWIKMGNHPALTAKALTKRLPEFLAQLAIKREDEALKIGHWSMMGELLDWYGERSATNSSIKNRRQVTIKTTLKCHLVPLLGGVPLRQMTRQLINERLMWPLQKEYALSTVKLIFNVLKAAMKQAFIVGLIETDPMVGLKFNYFITAKIDPKECALKGESGRAVIAQLYPLNVPKQTLVLLMLLHATRIGETRLSRWDDFDFVDKCWKLPKATTKTKAHNLPLTDQAIMVLDRHRAYQIYKGYHGVFLFPGSKNGQAISAMSVNEWIQEISQSQWSAHDLRKLTRSNMLGLGINHWIGDRVLNHAQSQIDETYIFDTYQLLMRDALNRYHQSLLPLGLSFFCHRDNPETASKRYHPTGHEPLATPCDPLI